VLQGLVVAALLSLVYVVARISRPTVMALVRDPADETWHRADHRPDLSPPVGVVVVRTEAPLLYPNANDVKERVLTLARATWDPSTCWASSRPRCGATGARSCSPRSGPPCDILARAGMTDGLRIANTVDEALESPGPGDA
jgi:sulfate permease, SulP family